MKNNVFKKRNLSYDKNLVVLLHGILNKASSLEFIEKMLGYCGYQVLNLEYNYKESISRIADNVHVKIQKHLNNLQEKKRIHFVGHQMGGLVIRVLLEKYEYPSLGRVLQISPPNKGNKIADLLKDNFFYKYFCGLAGQELVSNNQDLQIKMGEIRYQLGVIVGIKSTILSNFILSGLNDGLISVDSAKLECMEDYIEVYDKHSALLKKRKNFSHILSFLSDGFFMH